MSHSQAPLPRDKPRYLPFPCIKPKSPPEFPNLYFRRFLSRICTSRYQIIVHKILSWINSWQQKKTFTHQNRFGSRGLSVPDGKCEVNDQNLHKVLWQIFPGVHILPPAWQYDQSSAQRSFPAVMSNVTLVCKIPGCFNKMTNRNTWSCFTLLLDQNFTHWHQTSLFYSQKSLLVLNVDQEIKHHSKTQIWTVLEGDRINILWLNISANPSLFPHLLLNPPKELQRATKCTEEECCPIKFGVLH